MTKKKIIVVNNKLDGFGEIALRGDIGDFDGDLIANQISGSESNKTRMNINCFGGSVLPGMSIVTAMTLFQNSGGLIETINEGCADSTAGWIFSTGSKGHRKIMQFASMLLHPPMYADGVTITDLADGDPRKDVLNEAFDKLINIFVPITGNSYEHIKNLMLNNTELDADAAIREGFADEKIMVSNVPKIKNGISRAQLYNITSGLEFNTETNKPDSGLINRENMKTIASLVNLNPEASKEAVTGAVQEIINKAAKAESDLKVANSALEAEKAAHDTLKSAVENEKNEKVTNYVDALIKKDASKAPQREVLINMAKVDFKTFESMNPIKAVINKGAIIDENIDEDGDKDAILEAEIEEGKSFLNLSQDAKMSLKNSDFAKYERSAEMYEKHYSEIVK